MSYQTRYNSDKWTDLDRTEKMRLWKPSQWKKITPIDKIKAYNGVGADRFPCAVRWLLTLVNPLFLPAVLIHDFDYTYTGSGYWGFTISNLRLGVNMLLCTVYALLAVHKWICLSLTVLNVLFAPVKIILYPVICQVFGYAGYCIEKDKKYTITQSDV